MAEPAGERRIVTVLMADIAGSTAIAERLGPERSKFLFDELVRRTGDKVRGLGTVAQLSGTGSDFAQLPGELQARRRRAQRLRVDRLPSWRRSNLEGSTTRD